MEAALTADADAAVTAAAAATGITVKYGLRIMSGFLPEKYIKNLRFLFLFLSFLFYFKNKKVRKTDFM